MKLLRQLRREFGFHNSSNPTEKLITHLSHIRNTALDILKNEATYTNRRIYLEHELKLLDVALEQRSQNEFAQKSEIKTIAKLLREQLESETFSKQTITYLNTLLKMLL